MDWLKDFANGKETGITGLSANQAATCMAPYIAKTEFPIDGPQPQPRTQRFGAHQDSWRVYAQAGDRTLYDLEITPASGGSRMELYYRVGFKSDDLVFNFNNGVDACQQH
jgi:hypothetical protein